MARLPDPPKRPDPAPAREATAVKPPPSPTTAPNATRPPLNTAPNAARPPLNTPPNAARPPLSTPVRPRVTSEARRALIAENAYLRAERRGFEPGHETEDWLAAETEVDALLKAGRGAPQ